MALEDRDTALTTTAAVKAYLDITVTAEDSRIAGLILAASGMVSTHCERKFAETIHTKYLDGTGGERLYLPHWPIADPLEVDTTYGVWLSNDRTFGSSDKLVQTTTSNSYQDYWLHMGGTEGGQGILYRTNGTWGSGLQTIKAKWKAGYATIPDEIEFATKRLVAHMHEVAFRKMHARKREDLGVAGGRIDVFEPIKLPEDVRAILACWRRTWIA